MNTTSRITIICIFQMKIEEDRYTFIVYRLKRNFPRERDIFSSFEQVHRERE